MRNHGHKQINAKITRNIITITCNYDHEMKNREDLKELKLEEDRL